MDVVDVSQAVFQVVTCDVDVGATLTELRRAVEEAYHVGDVELAGRFVFVGRDRCDVGEREEEGTTVRQIAWPRKRWVRGLDKYWGAHERPLITLRSALYADGFANGTMRTKAHFAALANRPWNDAWPAEDLDRRDYMRKTPVDLALTRRAERFLLTVPTLTLRTACHAAVADLPGVVAAADKQHVFSDPPRPLRSMPFLPPPSLPADPARSPVQSTHTPYPYTPAARVTLDDPQWGRRGSSPGSPTPTGTAIRKLSSVLVGGPGSRSPSPRPSPRRVSWAMDLQPSPAAPAAQALKPITRKLPADRLRRAPRVLPYLAGRDGIDWAGGVTYPLLTAPAPIPALTLQLCPAFFLSEDRVAPAVLELCMRGDVATLQLLMADDRVMVALRRSRAPLVATACRYLPKGCGWVVKAMVRARWYVGPAWVRRTAAGGTAEELHRCAVKRVRKHHVSAEQDGGLSPSFHSSPRLGSFLGSFGSWHSFGTTLSASPPSAFRPMLDAAAASMVAVESDGDDSDEPPPDLPHQIPGCFAPTGLRGAALEAPSDDVRRRILARDPWASLVISLPDPPAGVPPGGPQQAAGVFSHPAAPVRVAPLLVWSRVPHQRVRLLPPDSPPLFGPAPEKISRADPVRRPRGERWFTSAWGAYLWQRVLGFLRGADLCEALRISRGVLWSAVTLDPTALHTSPALAIEAAPPLEHVAAARSLVQRRGAPPDPLLTNPLALRLVAEHPRPVQWRGRGYHLLTALLAARGPGDSDLCTAAAALIHEQQCDPSAQLRLGDFLGHERVSSPPSPKARATKAAEAEPCGWDALGRYTARDGGWFKVPPPRDSDAPPPAEAPPRRRLRDSWGWQMHPAAGAAWRGVLHDADAERRQAAQVSRFDGAATMVPQSPGRRPPLLPAAYQRLLDALEGAGPGAITAAAEEAWAGVAVPLEAPTAGSLMAAVMGCEHPQLFAVVLTAVDRLLREQQQGGDGGGLPVAWFDALYRRRAVRLMGVFVPLTCGHTLAAELQGGGAAHYVDVVVAAILAWGADAALGWACLGPLFAASRTAPGACARYFAAAVRKGDASVRWLLERYPLPDERAELNDGDAAAALFLAACHGGCTALLRHHYSVQESPDVLPEWLLYRGAHVSLAMGRWETFVELMAYIRRREIREGVVDAAGAGADGGDEAAWADYYAGAPQVNVDANHSVATLFSIMSDERSEPSVSSATFDFGADAAEGGACDAPASAGLLRRAWGGDDDMAEDEQLPTADPTAPPACTWGDGGSTARFAWRAVRASWLWGEREGSGFMADDPAPVHEDCRLAVEYDMAEAPPGLPSALRYLDDDLECDESLFNALPHPLRARIAAAFPALLPLGRTLRFQSHVQSTPGPDACDHPRYGGYPHLPAWVNEGLGPAPGGAAEGHAAALFEAVCVGDGRGAAPDWHSPGVQGLTLFTPPEAPHGVDAPAPPPRVVVLTRALHIDRTWFALATRCYIRGGDPGGAACGRRRQAAPPPYQPVPFAMLVLTDATAAASLASADPKAYLASLAAQAFSGDEGDVDETTPHHIVYAFLARHGHTGGGDGAGFQITWVLAFSPCVGGYFEPALVSLPPQHRGAASAAALACVGSSKAARVLSSLVRWKSEWDVPEGGGCGVAPAFHTPRPPAVPADERSEPTEDLSEGGESDASIGVWDDEGRAAALRPRVAVTLLTLPACASRCTRLVVDHLAPGQS